MELHLLENRKLGGFTSFGSCWKKGEVNEEKFTVKNSRGERIAVQNEIAARWPDGSVKWARHTADSEKLGETVTVYPGVEHAGSKETDFRRIVVLHMMDCYQIDAGRIKMRIPEAGSDCLVGQVWMDGWDTSFTGGAPCL